jgi:hypothetical protein
MNLSGVLAGAVIAGVLYHWLHRRFPVRDKIVLRKALEKTLSEGLAQTREYGERCAADEMHFVVFDRSKKLWSKKIFKRTRNHQGATIKIWGR